MILTPMKPVKLILATFVILAASVCELSAQSSSSATQTVTFGVRRMMPVLLASIQMTASSISESRGSQNNTLKMTVGSETNSDHVTNLAVNSVERRFAARDDQESIHPNHSTLAPPKAQKSKSSKLIITVTE